MEMSMRSPDFPDRSENAHLTYGEFMNSVYPPHDRDYTSIVKRWDYSTERGFSYILFQKRFDGYMLVILFLPLLFIFLVSMVRNKRILKFLLPPLLLLPITAGFLRTFPIYDYAAHYLMPPSMHSKLADCANASVFAGLFSTLLCISVVVLGLLVKLFTLTTKDRNKVA
jgi:hypothetical protein